jgi:hypothetical protein
MGFSVRVGKGVRLRASSRGLGASFGSGRTRAFVGEGRRGVGVSVPVAGPVRYYTTVGGGGRSSMRTTLSQCQKQVQQAQQIEEMQRLSAQLQEMVSIHKQDFPRVQHPVAPPSNPVDEASILKRYTKEQIRGIPLHRIRERREAKQRAATLASEEIEQERKSRDEERAKYQQQLDEQWAALLANDPPAVLPALEASFADNSAPAVPVNCEEGRATIVMLMEGEEAVPERHPAVTPTGRPTLKKFTKAERAQFYLAWVSSNLLATIKEAFAVAPCLSAVTGVVLQQGRNPFGDLEVSALYCGTFTRDRFERLDFDKLAVLDAILYADDLRIKTKGQAKQLVPLDLSKDQELAQVVDQVKAVLGESRADG